MSYQFKVCVHGRAVSTVKCTQSKFRPQGLASIEPVPLVNAHIVSAILPENFTLIHPVFNQVRDVLGVSKTELYDGLRDAAGVADYETRRAA